ncbi:enoyl-CoA hydratase/isomerase family protein [Rhodococcus olei]|uniref:Enoyl-CoA hydratase/isomerase family protein n=1 Tax=Rhodococcus olei TaxID=2161675 RepID=A0ABP8NYL1_9NOCA
MTSVDLGDIFETGLPIESTLEGAVRRQVRADHVAVVEFTRAPHNYFDRDMVAALVQACERSADDGARAVVLCSAGKSFCAGADLAATPEGGFDPAPLYGEAVKLFRQPLPMVAAIQGAAIGGGAGLALAADLRVASPQARFAVNFATIGIHHGFGLSVTLPRVVGNQAAMDLLYTGRRISAEEALRIGLVDRLSAVPDVRIDALMLAQQIAASAPLAVAAIRRTLRGDLADRVAQAVATECTEQLILSESADFAEGVRAVAERRPGNFIAR